jgi:hypothetical protein
VAGLKIGCLILTLYLFNQFVLLDAFVVIIVNQDMLFALYSILFSKEVLNLVESRMRILSNYSP